MAKLVVLNRAWKAGVIVIPFTKRDFDLPVDTSPVSMTLTPVPEAQVSDFVVTKIYCPDADPNGSYWELLRISNQKDTLFEGVLLGARLALSLDALPCLTLLQFAPGSTAIEITCRLTPSARTYFNPRIYIEYTYTVPAKDQP